MNFGQLLVMPSWLSYLLAGAPGVVALLLGHRNARRRGSAGLSSRSLGGLVMQAGVMTLALGAVAYYINPARGVP